jgi:hypothetical protein
MLGVKRSLLLAALIGFLAGVLWLVAVRFLTYRDDTVHYHANFALYINGEREQFDNFTFYEEVQSCGGDDLNNPRIRVHMHDQVNHVVHVHDHAATWGHFFANLGFGLTDAALKTDDALYVGGVGGNELTFILNGEKVSTIANRVIGDEDVLLIDYGQDDEDALQGRYDDISTDAGEYNQKADPSACKGAEPLTFKDRLWRAVGVGR